MKNQPQNQSQNQPPIQQIDQSQNPSERSSPRPLSFVGRLLERSQRRFRLSRPGSVLILCVALLVLLALIGTAMISTARIDRYASVQHTYNTQIDLLVEGVKAMAEGWIDDDLYQASTTTIPTKLFRPADADVDQTGSSNFDKYDAVDLVDTDMANKQGANDAWIASRVPQLQDPTLPANPLSNPPLWPALTMPLAGQTVNNTTVYRFDSPYSSGTTTIDTLRVRGIPTTITIAGTVYPAMNINNGTFMAADTDGDGIADAMYFKLPMGPIAGVTYYAACRIIDNNSAINANTAWCRDYDFTNVSGGFSRSSNQTASTANYGFFRSNVGFMEMFPDYTTAGTGVGTSNQMNSGSLSINGYRFGTPTGSANPLNAAADFTPKVYYRDPTTGSVTFRSDFSYVTQGDGLEFGLASRLENPGINFFSNDGTFANYRAFSPADTAALVSRFAILNPSASACPLETDGTVGLMMRLNKITGTKELIPSSAYQPSDSVNWYAQNFDYSSTTYQRMPLRPILVSRNPVSDLAPVPHGPYDYNADGVGSFSINGSTAPGGNDPLTPPYLIIDPGQADDWTWSTAVTKRLGMSPYMLGTSKAAVSAKTNINSAPFEELWRAFWSVMGEVKTSQQTYRVGAFPPLYPTPDNGIFRSPSRDPRPSSVTAPVQVKPTSSNMLQIRSALAAINAVDLRDGDDDVTTREIPVYDMNVANAAPALKYRVRVFGNERQPFITKIYFNGYTDKLASGDIPPGPPADSKLIAENINPKGYIAIELYNPYPTPMLLNRWAIGVINREPPSVVPSSYAQAGLDQGLHIARLTTHIPAFTSGFDEHYLNQVDRVTGKTTPAQVLIPAQGYAVLENFPPSTMTGFTPSAATDATYRPPRVFVTDAQGHGNAATIAFVYVPNLTDVIQDVAGTPSGGELVLLRPRRADGTLTQSNPTIDPVHGANNTYHEVFSDGVTPNIADFVPIDAYDFTGLVQIAPSASALYPSWYYSRPNDATTNAWKFVYPGLYNVGDTTTATGTSPATPRQEGTTGPGVDFTFAQLSADTGPKVVLGVGNGGTYTNPFPGIQLQNVDWGVNSTYDRWPATNFANSPPGGFPAKPKTTATFQYPFGGFARNGDMMMVPFIGAYQILPTTFTDGNYAADVIGASGKLVNPTPFYELTPITMDCSFADDCQRTATIPTRSSYAVRNTAVDVAGANDDADEQVGRFCPIQESTAAGVRDLTAATEVATQVPYYTNATTVHWKYHFATRLFDYLTVQGGSDDYLPMADPNIRDPNLSGVAGSVLVPSNMTPAPPAIPLNVYPGPSVNPAQNSLNPAQAADHRIPAQTGIENRLPIDGLININTAPWYVIAQLPLLPPSSAGAVTPGGDGIPANIETLAKAIVNYRDSGHPFTSIFDLQAFFVDPTLNPIPQTGVASGGTDWDISPTGAQATGDFESKYLLLTRISNLITTRSDSYTVFIVVDGFRLPPAGSTAAPELVVHRRVAFIADRSAITPEAGTDFADRINVATQ